MLWVHSDMYHGDNPIIQNPHFMQECKMDQKIIDIGSNFYI